MPFFMAEVQPMADSLPVGVAPLHARGGLGRSQSCPPELFSRSRPAWQRWVARWLRGCRLAWGRQARSGGAPLARIHGAREAFFLSVADLHGPAVDALRDRIARARSLRELWHLRLEVFQLLARSRGQAHAQQRLGELDLHFPTRISPPPAVAASRVAPW